MPGRADAFYTNGIAQIAGRPDTFCTYWMFGRADAFSTNGIAQSRPQKDTAHILYALCRTKMSATVIAKYAPCFFDVRTVVIPFVPSVSALTVGKM
jgi:hypothetical protein